MHSSSLGLNKQDGKHQEWPMSGSPLGNMRSLDSSYDLQSGKKPRFLSRPHVGIGVPHPGVALCWLSLEDGRICMSSGKALSAGRESHP